MNKDRSLLAIQKEVKIIKSAVHKKCLFYELSFSDQIATLQYVKRKSLPFKFFEKRGYDLLKQSFFANEYILDEGTDGELILRRHDFEFFSDFYEYLDGNIFDNACYFGYKFTKSDINLYKSSSRRINRSCFERDTISNHSLELYLKSENEKASFSIEKNRRITQFLKNMSPIFDYQSLINNYSLFSKKFRGSFDRDIFFQFVCNSDDLRTRDALIEYACYHDKYEGFSFKDVLLNFGITSAKKVIDCFQCYSSESTYYRRKAEFRKIIKHFEKNELSEKVQGFFNHSEQLYFVIKTYFFNNTEIMRINKIFLTFEMMINYLNGDLRNCDFSKANLDNSSFDKYITDKTTILPIDYSCIRHEVSKGYDKYGFFVEQTWYDKFDKIIHCDSIKFQYFCDFYYFLDGDISNADLIECDGIENIKNIKGATYNNIKIRSDIALKLGIEIPTYSLPNIEDESFEYCSKNEMISIETFIEKRDVFNDYDMTVGYITDLHLTHRFKANNCQSKEDCIGIMRKIVKNFNTEFASINLIGGDIASDPNIFKEFIETLNENRFGRYFITLGNHELWGFSDLPFEERVKCYRDIVTKKGMYLVNNNVFLIKKDCVEEITEDDLKNSSVLEIRNRARDACLIIFGGIGFSGNNLDFNANNGVYGNCLSREQEIEMSKYFNDLYHKVGDAFADKNVIILTHMPMRDWSKDEDYKKGFVYVSGHNHKNYYYDDGLKRIYSDNQIGYKQKDAFLKKLSIDFNYDWFSDYKEGIHQITRNDYEWFYRGLGEGVCFNREFLNLYMLKKENVYMFLMKTTKGKLMVLNGGTIKNADSHDLLYYYDNLVNYSKSVHLYLKSFSDFQISVSKDIKSIGGSGRIHGCIIDIDFFNHLYVNPIDRTITPYSATSIVDKHVFKNIASLLKYCCKGVYKNLIENTNKGNSLIAINKNDLQDVSNDSIYVGSTEMYKFSRILRGLQYTLKNNVVRIWSDAMAGECSEEKGKIIVMSLLTNNDIEKK